jgi:hypothetical protein
MSNEIIDWISISSKLFDLEVQGFEVLTLMAQP